MKRIEIKKNIKQKIRLRLSRTDGLNASAHPVKGLTLNNKYGLRVSKSFKGLMLGFQGKNSVFKGRWSLLNDFLNVNLSKKSGLSFSTAFRFGAINWNRPQYSSFRFLGIQIRGKKAHEYAVLVFFLATMFNLAKALIGITFAFLIFIIQLFLNVAVIIYKLIELFFNSIIFLVIKLYNRQNINKDLHNATEQDEKK